MLSGFYSLGRQNRNTFSKEGCIDGGGDDKGIVNWFVSEDKTSSNE
jgi:hypothetical protein